ATNVSALTATIRVVRALTAVASAVIAAEPSSARAPMSELPEGEERSQRTGEAQGETGGCAHAGIVSLGI
ncbi:MAG: hypothetical protein ACTIC1_11825, partial [Brevibacterium sp.]